MKRTLIALLALTGSVMGAVEKTTDLMPSSISWKTYTAPDATTPQWVEIDWGNLNATNIETDLTLLGISTAGNYAFNRQGAAEVAPSQAALTSNSTALTLTGRGGASKDVFFASVVTMETLLHGYSFESLTKLSVSVSYTRNGGDAWIGLYILDEDNSLTQISAITNNALKTGTGADLSLSFTESQLNNLASTDKLVVLLRDGSSGKTTTITNLKAVATVPEPTTATLSLLALAGLAARRRRASR